MKPLNLLFLSVIYSNRKHLAKLSAIMEIKILKHMNDHEIHNWSERSACAALGLQAQT